jgi:type IX secretion system PorP/SprF family membrane protein
MRRAFFILIIMVITGRSFLPGQDPMFTQFYAAPLYLGPSFAGGNGETRAILNVRDQWPKLPGDYLTYAFSLDHYMDKFSSGIGLLVSRDEAAGGLINTTNIGINYNYNFNVSRKWRLSPGIQTYYYMKSIDYNNLVFSDQISRDYTTPVSIEMERLSSIPPIGHLDVTTSLLAFSDTYWAGFTVDHLLTLNSSLKDERGYLPIRFSLYGGGKYVISQLRRSQIQESLSGAFHFMMQDKYKYLDLGAYYTKPPMQFGIWYRGLPVFPDNPNNGAVALLFGYNIKNVTVAYSYDYTVSRLITKTGGAHEVSLALGIQTTERKKKRRMIPCPVL